MKNIRLSSLLLIIFGAALTCFLWLPLLPVIIPMVTLTLGAKWIESILFSSASRRTNLRQALNYHSFHYNPMAAFARDPMTNLSQPNASSPAQIGPETVFEKLEPDKSIRNSVSKKTIRDYRKFTRVMSGLTPRRHFAHT